MYLEQIKQLVVLQAVDDEIIIIEEELEAAPRELAGLESRLEGLNEQRGHLNEKEEILKAQQSKLDGEIEEDTSKVKKSKNKLMLVGNTREYHAMMREMDNLEKLNRLREEERVAVVEELGRLEEVAGGLEGEREELQAECDSKKDTLDERVEKARKRLSSLDKKRKKACKVVPAPILGRYEFIRSRIENPVIVSVTDGICSGCHIMIPPQTYNELQKGQQIIGCPNCQRLVYWEEHAPGKD